MTLAAAVPAFFASLVEFVEALTIVLAVGATRGWRSAWAGVVAGSVLLSAVVAVLGPLLALVPLHAIQLAVGGLLLLFGMRWLRKATLRYAGAIPLHDEAAIYAKQTAQLGGTGRRSGSGEAGAGGIDPSAAFVAFNAVVLEGLEVVFIVIAVGASTGALVSAALGAGVACLIVLAAGFAVRRPLSQVPENLLKFAVGIMLSAFGTFWSGEGLGLTWPSGDFALLALVAGFAIVGLAGIAIGRRRQAGALASVR